MADLKKLIKVTTVAESLLAFHKGHGELLHRHFDVVAVSSYSQELYRFSEREKIRVISVNMQRRISVFKDFLSIYRMYRVFRNEKPFIVHSMTPKAGLVSMSAAFLAGVPHRIHTFTGLVFPTEKGIKRFVLINIDRLICLLATRIIPEGNGVKNDLINNRITHKHLNVIANGNFNGVDLDHYNPSLPGAAISQIKSGYSISPDNFHFGFAGRIVRDKGIEELVLAFCEILREHPHARLVLLGKYEGEDPLSAEVLKLIKSTPEIIHIPPQDDIRDFLAMIDVYVLPSYREGFPNTVLEAGAMGIPCIVTDINGSNEIISDGINGLIVKKKDVPALKTAMKRMISDQVLRNEMAMKARPLIRMKFDRKFVQSQLLELYLNLR